VPVINRMATVQVLPLNNYATGTHGPFGPVEVASDVTSILFNILCNSTAQPTIWPNVTTVLTTTPEVSTDAGVTWTEAGKSVTPGGPHTSKFGTELQSILSGGSLPAQVGNTPRQYRVTLAITGGPLRSSATVEVN
jgi:hypothetical protein